MSQAERQSAAKSTDDRIQEIKASAHLMTLDDGLFCIVNGSPLAGSGVLAGVRVSAVNPRDPRVAIKGFREDGWLEGAGDSALIRVTGGPIQILVTIYQSSAGPETAPKLRVLRLSESGAPVPAAPAEGKAATPVMQLAGRHDVIAHVQRAGDIGRPFGDWIGEPGSRRWMEGFSITAPDELSPADVTYQAVLGRGWLSPWSEAGQFCGSRGMALPILGIKVRLSAKAAERYDLSYEASFIDGTTAGPVGAEESCETAALAPVEALRIFLTPKGEAKPAAPAKPAPKAVAAEEKPAAKPGKAAKAVPDKAATPAPALAAAKKAPTRRR